jgi:hypothetical protein
VPWSGLLSRGEEQVFPVHDGGSGARNIDHQAVPRERTVVSFSFPDVLPPARYWWLVITPEDADVCDADPGYPVSVAITATLLNMTRIWRGDLSWTDALHVAAVTIDGPAQLRRAVPQWFTLSAFAAVSRPG